MEQTPHLLCLQGMPSRFFPRIAAGLREAGWRVSRIHFCVGDRLFWRAGDASSYRGRYRFWPDSIRAYFAREQVTHLLLLGEHRRYHREAVAIAKELGIQVWVTDFGYTRPDWLAFERNGMSGGSLFPRDPDRIRALAAAAGEIDWYPQYRDHATPMVLGDLFYNFANVFLGFCYPFYRRSDRRPPTIPYTYRSALRLLGNKWQRRRTVRAQQALIASQRPYFLFPLQLSFDFQIVAYSRFADMREAIEEVLRSFAAHASPDTLLVLKEHPWDPAMPDLAGVSRRLAETLGIAERLRYLRGGNIDLLTAGSRGMVVVNSTSGMRALVLRRPLLALGEAIYDVPGLIHPGSLDSFWQRPQAPDSQLVEDFLHALAHSVQIRGGVFTEPGMSHAIAAAIARLQASLNAPPDEELAT